MITKPMNPIIGKTILSPPVIWMELKCKRTDDEIVLFRPRVPYRTTREATCLILTPIPVPKPGWVVPREFVPYSFALEAHSNLSSDECLFVWSVAHQEIYRPGDEIIPTVCTIDIEYTLS